MQPSKSLSEKSCEIKGGGNEMAAMMLMIINFNNGLYHIAGYNILVIDMSSRTGVNT